MAVTRVVASSAGRTGGEIHSYDANLPWEIRGVTSVSLVAATIPYPPALLVPGAYAVLRIDGMEVTSSNDGVLDRCFVALPCVDNIQKVLPTTYYPSRPLRRLARFRVSLVDQAGAPIDFLGQEHILQFDVEHVGHVEPVPDRIASSLGDMVDPPPAEGPIGAYEISDGTAEVGCAGFNNHCPFDHISGFAKS
jgi:hypothetical protein